MRCVGDSYHGLLCGRFALAITGDAIATALGAQPLLPAFVDALKAWQGRFNIAPSIPIPVVVESATGGAGNSGRELIFAKWGLIPFWSKDSAIGARLSNARSDSVTSKPAFRAAWKSRRCLVPVTAYYEWQAPAEGETKKRAFAIASEDGELMTLGGLWERWRDPTSGGEMLSCAIITSDACEALKAIHGRMPIVVGASMRDRWLHDADAAATLLGTGRAELSAPDMTPPLRSWPVSALVNSVRNDSSACLAPLGDSATNSPSGEFPGGLW